MNLELLLKKARRTNAERDEIDRAAGETAPVDKPVTSLLDTAIAAIEAGVETNDWCGVAEGLVMLYDVNQRLCEPNSARQADEIQHAHDLLVPIMQDQAAFFKKSDLTYSVHSSLEVLCWVLHHDHNRNFGEFLRAVERLYQDLGIVSRRADKMQYPGGV